MTDLFFKYLDKIYEDIEQKYVHDDLTDNDVKEILEMIINLKTKIKWTL